MDIRVVTLRYSESLGGFPEEPLRQVLATGNVVEQREYFFTHGGRAAPDAGSGDGQQPEWAAWRFEVWPRA